MQLVVGRIGRAHGVKGEVAVEVRTDDPDRRFAAGSSLRTDPVERGPLTVVRSRPHSGRLLVLFQGVADRDAAESLRGTLLTVDSADSQPLDDPDEFYDHELMGLAVVTLDGSPVGEVTDVLHPPGPDLLVVGREDGGEVLVPFVRDIVPTIDVPAGRLVLDPPPGLLDLDAAE
jgi:16S rRNA processing protein RimM